MHICPIYRGVVPGGAGGAMAQILADQLTRGTYYVHLITTGTPRFSDRPTALIYTV